MRKEVQSLAWVKKLTFNLDATKMAIKIIGDQARSKDNESKTPLVKVNMVDFILNWFWIGIHQLNSLTWDMLAKETK